MKVRLTHLDGKLPNLALMKLSHWHKSLGDDIVFSRKARPHYTEKEYDIVYGSSIFSFGFKLQNVLKFWYPNAIIGGTGTINPITVEEIIGQLEYEHYDYSIYPEYEWSLGFTQRGCRLKCKFCVVPQKEGKPRSVNSIYDIYRPNTPRNIVLLDNDFFGQPEEQWKERINELIDGSFKVSFNQGLNIRLVNEEQAHWLAKVKYYDDQFKTRRLYTAWDNLRDEKIFFRGVDILEDAGIPPKHLFVYMLVGYDSEETWERIFYRFNKMVEREIRPYPMVYNNKNKELKKFQRWVVRRYYEFIPWEEFTNKKLEKQIDNADNN